MAQLKYLGTDKSNAEMAADLEVSQRQIANYLKFLKARGAIAVRTARSSFKGTIKSHRKIEVK